MYVYHPSHFGTNIFGLLSQWTRGSGLENDLIETNDASLVFSQPIKFCFLPMYFNNSNIKTHYVPNVSFDFLKNFDVIFFWGAEFLENLDNCVDWFDALPLKNKKMIYGFYSKKYKNRNDLIYKPYYMQNVVYYNTFQNTNCDMKPYVFDVLLGMPRQNRDYVFNSLVNENLLEKNIVTYRHIDTWNCYTLKSEKNKIPSYPYISPHFKNEWEISFDTNNLPEYGDSSKQIPWEIYKNSYYSLITESLFNHEPNKIYFTEKVAKPMYAKRLFVHFGQQHYLNTLKDLGYKTFDSVIDESYDTCSNYIIRFKKAFEQVKLLHNLPFDEVQKQISDIVEHNHNHLIYSMKKYDNKSADLLLKGINGAYGEI